MSRAGKNLGQRSNRQPVDGGALRAQLIAAGLLKPSQQRDLGVGHYHGTLGRATLRVDAVTERCLDHPHEEAPLARF